MSDERIPALVQTAVDALVREMKPRRIILFGSVARGEHDPESDVDLLVVLDSFESRFFEMKRAADLVGRLRVPADVVVYSQAEVDRWSDVVNHFINDALREGRVVYDAA